MDKFQNDVFMVSNNWKCFQMFFNMISILVVYKSKLTNNQNDKSLAGLK